MADAKKCDRCGKYYDNCSPKYYMGDYKTFVMHQDYFDLCEECESELEQWFEMEYTNDQDR